MIKMFGKMLNNRKGFTLIELIVVIAILGILAAIAVPRFAGFTDSAKIAADEQLVATANKALLLLEETTGDTPASDATAAGVIEWLRHADQGMLESDASFNFPADYEYDDGENRIKEK